MFSQVVGDYLSHFWACRVFLLLFFWKLETCIGSNIPIKVLQIWSIGWDGWLIRCIWVIMILSQNSAVCKLEWRSVERQKLSRKSFVFEPKNQLIKNWKFYNIFKNYHATSIRKRDESIFSYLILNRVTFVRIFPPKSTSREVEI